MSLFAGCGSDGTSEGPESTDSGATEPTSTPVDEREEDPGPTSSAVADDVFPDEDVIGYPLADVALSEGFEFFGSARLYTFDAVRDGLAGVDNLQVWPAESYDIDLDELDPIATGDDAAQVLADKFFQRSDPTECWSIEPPEIVERGAANYGGAEEYLTIEVLRFVDEAAATTQVDGYASEAILTTEASHHRLGFTFGSDGGQTNIPCGPYDPLDQPCATVPNCVRGPGGADDAPVAAAHRGPWVVKVETSPALDPESYLATTITGLPD